jgi:aa3 type cytochrome c oxidase subunit IV
MSFDQAEVNENMDMPAHVQTYESFLTFLKYSVATVAFVLICMAIFLT